MLTDSRWMVHSKPLRENSMVKSTYFALLIGCVCYSIMGAAVTKPFNEVSHALNYSSEAVRNKTNDG
jgi:hypothetical protein